MPTRYRFASFVLDPEERALFRLPDSDERGPSADADQGADGGTLLPVPLQDLPLRLLCQLVESAPNLVSRDQLRRALWPPQTHLDVDASLNTAVARVREALRDQAGNPRFVATVPRRGYRFLATVQSLPTAPGDDAPLRKPGQPVAPASRALRPPTLGRRGRLVALTLAALVVLGLGWLWRTLPRPLPIVARAGDVIQQGPAYEHLVIARHHAEHRSEEGLVKSIASYQSALAIEPDLAEAYSGLANVYTLLALYDFWRPREAMAPAETMARRAMELAPESAEANLAMGLVLALGKWDWPEAERRLQRAAQLAPDSPEVRSWRSAWLSAMGQHEEAVAEARAALSLDPSSPVFNVGLAWRLFQARDYGAAIAQSHRAIELTPDYYDAWDDLKWIHLSLGQESEAIAAWMRAQDLDQAPGADGRSRGGGAAIEQAYLRGGLLSLHQSSIRSQEARWHSGRYQSPYDVALEHAAAGDSEGALLWLQRSFDEREPDLIQLAVDPRMDLLRAEPAFQIMLHEIGLPTQTPFAQGQASNAAQGRSVPR